jgi:uncharacterized cupin superfamily protein
MDEATNIWEDVPDWGRMGARRLIRQPGGGLGASIWDIHPGGESWHHFHHASDELLVVLLGRPTVKTPDGTRELAEGDVLPLPRGPAGARTITNETDAVARVLIVSTNADPDVAEYPDNAKVGIWLHEHERFFRNADAVEHAGPED